VTIRYVPSFTEADGSVARRCKRIVQPAMFLAAFAAQLFKGPNQTMARYLAVVWLAFMAPYVVIGLHIRHVLPVSCILVLSAFLGLDTIAARVGPFIWRARASGV
jgi:uncharacterized membrane protein